MKHVIIIFSVIFLFVNCSNKIDKQLEKEIEALLVTNSSNLDYYGYSILKKIEERTLKPEYREVALMWYPKGLKTDSIYQILEKEIKSFTIFDKEKLFNCLINYKNSIKNIDTSLFAEIQKIFIVTSLKDSVEVNKGNFFTTLTTENFNLKSKLFLTKAKNLRNIFMEVIEKNSFNSFCGYFKEYPLVNQNSKQFNFNDTLEINAGIGYYYYYPKAYVLIDNDTLMMNYDLVFNYKKNVGKIKGKISKKIEIGFETIDGKKRKMEKQINYTVE